MAKIDVEAAKVREIERIQFVVLRDGLEAGIEFVDQTYMVYKVALTRPYGKAYRTHLLVACAVLRRYRDAARPVKCVIEIKEDDSTLAC